MKKFFNMFVRMGAALFVFLMPLALYAATATTTPAATASAKSAAQIIDGNVIRLGRVIEINEAVKGDIIVAGNTITINGPVAGDVIAAGNVVRINGAVNGSVRVVGMSVEINGAVDQNVWAAGSSVNITKQAAVGWDVFAAGSTVEVRGPVGGNVTVAGATIAIGSSIAKNISATLQSNGQLVLEKGAAVSGDVTYRADNDNQFVKNDGANVSGKINRQPLSSTQTSVRSSAEAASVFLKIVSFFSLLVIGLILVSLFSKFLLMVNDEMVKQPAQSIGWGIIYLIMVPVIVILLFITVIGIPLALIIVPFYVLSLYVAKVFAAFTIGLYVFNQSSEAKKYKGSLLWPLIGGLIIIIIISSLPLIGWVIKFLLMLWAVGAILKIKRGILVEYR